MRFDLKRRLGLALGALVAMTLPAVAGICERRNFDGQGYVVCTLAADQQPGLQLWLNGPDGRVLGDFAALRRNLPDDRVLVFAMNAGMYHPDYQPVGLFVSDGVKSHELVTAGGGGNFGMLPNGVFCAGGARPYQVIESRAFARSQPQCRLATQSGPMLVIDGALHPRFLVDSDSRYIRNGVGVSADGRTAWFAISDRAVTFHEFGRLFRDELGARDALYFDGSISRLYAPALNRADFGRRLGPIIGYTEQK
ncbi:MULTISPECIES: phosphodiester glycosidase family protein [unclassified Paracoccus (in: a-proteobacteria)]|uniref:phosphodiester glycosidase family protein n=1 Tax=unclassified Paracoccus (in: a-proteobacteria) TaxID=2688777 RepID=UPI0012B3E86F|nr:MULTISPECIES: phosphodiester glycosidase family protein [unclassified Paracoccus (in: a-proteobacteria)]UXU75757.1 phosphodiester glycosidase family protein [Paracoccus sp. SMMA_5]UXU81666.1 phosphodiester glycosidase family protein [Paracoccus sp. SMMA_5_TC]